jgi:hypothetical protein
VSSAGHYGDSRKILIAQREDQLRRASATRRERMWGRFTGVILCYGYKPERALLWLLAVVTAAVAVTAIGGQNGALAHTSRTSSPGTPCTAVERIGVGLDLGLPLIKTGAWDSCATAATGAAEAMTVALWLLQIAAWALATLFIAGFTGAVRKT